MNPFFYERNHQDHHPQPRLLKMHIGDSEARKVSVRVSAGSKATSTPPASMRLRKDTASKTYWIEKRTPPKGGRKEFAAGPDVQKCVKEASKSLRALLTPIKVKVTKQPKIIKIPEPTLASKPAVWRRTSTRPSPSEAPNVAAGKNCGPNVIMPIMRSPTALVTPIRPLSEKMKVLRDGRRSSSTNVKARIVKPVSRDSLVQEKSVGSTGRVVKPVQSPVQRMML